MAGTCLESNFDLIELERAGGLEAALLRGEFVVDSLLLGESMERSDRSRLWVGDAALTNFDKKLGAIKNKPSWGCEKRSVTDMNLNNRRHLPKCKVPCNGRADKSGSQALNDEDWRRPTQYPMLVE